MRCKLCRLALALALLLPAAMQLSGCGKYDHLERNMQYVSDDLLRQDAQVSWETLVKAHEAWRSSGGGHEPDNVAFNAYKDAYVQYSIVYNELLDRSNGGFAGRLHAPTDELPPPPPGVSAPVPKTSTPAPIKAAPTPTARDLSDAAPAGPNLSAPAASAPARGIPVAAPAKDNPFAMPKGEAAAPAKKTAVAAASPAGSGDRYVIAPGDTLRSIAKRHGITEKSLMDANGITDPDKIAAGKALTIPARQ
ncbi:LysM peptidoglycan-binding domain-containing protein [Solidesulfovibrio sp.]|uniref:LysM peptidoglycan-binding domain-containing protein n=1 Tax=Solidesulfovibrio sp. TaxID=2910990 RepID=UPI002603ECFE|nr:LysM peptidoglycan-binding domain-containing protein [Solidesulfovibrio sp.]